MEYEVHYNQYIDMRNQQTMSIQPMRWSQTVTIVVLFDLRLSHPVNNISVILNPPGEI